MLYLKMRRNFYVHVVCYTFWKTFLNKLFLKSNTILSFRKTFSFCLKNAFDEEPITILDKLIQCLTAFTVKNIVFAGLQHHCLTEWNFTTIKTVSPRGVIVLMKSRFKIFTIKLRRLGHLFLCTPHNFFPVISVFTSVVIYGSLYWTLYNIQLLQPLNSQLQQPSAEVLTTLPKIRVMAFFFFICYSPDYTGSLQLCMPWHSTEIRVRLITYWALNLFQNKGF